MNSKKPDEALIKSADGELSDERDVRRATQPHQHDFPYERGEEGAGNAARVLQLPRAHLDRTLCEHRFVTFYSSKSELKTAAEEGVCFPLTCISGRVAVDPLCQPKSFETCLPRSAACVC